MHGSYLHRNNIWGEKEALWLISFPCPVCLVLRNIFFWQSTFGVLYLFFQQMEDNEDNDHSSIILPSSGMNVIPSSNLMSTS